MGGSLLNNAASALWTRIKSAGSQTVRYSRAGDSVTLSAVPGRSTHEVTNFDGQIGTVQTQDWLVLASDLVLGTLQVKPVRGSDRVELLSEATPPVVLRTFKVTHPTGQEPFRYSDQYRTILRIHTMEVE